jgi:hypothetical protein
MASTATLNGGPTGGLHATPTTPPASLIASSNNLPAEEETCRVESNSSFESGHEEGGGGGPVSRSSLGHLITTSPLTSLGGPNWASNSCPNEASELAASSGERHSFSLIVIVYTGTLTGNLRQPVILKLMLLHLL